MSDDINALRDALFSGTVLRAVERTAVATPFRRAVAALILDTKQVEFAGGVVLIDGQPVEDVVRSWCASDAARPFLVAAGSGNGRPPVPVGLRKSQMSASQKGEHIRVHGLESYSSLPA